MPAKAIGVHSRFRIHIHSAVEQPARYFYFIVIDRHVEQGCTRQGRSMGGEDFIMAPHFRWIDFRKGEGSLQQRRMTVEMSFQQVNPSAMQRHWGRVR